MVNASGLGPEGHEFESHHPDHLLKKEDIKMNKNAYVFDVDDTLLRTNAKIKVIDRKTKEVKKVLSSQELINYKIGMNEYFDFSEFDDPKYIQTSLKLPYGFKILRTIFNGIQKNKSQSKIYILTARTSKIRDAIHKKLKSEGMDIPTSNIFTVGDMLKTISTIAERKQSILIRLARRFDKIEYFDDDPRNLQQAAKIKKVVPRQPKGMISFKEFIEI